MLITAGIDLGSGYTKVVLLCEDGHVVARAIGRTKANFDAGARDVYEKALSMAGVAASDVAYVATAGLGRYSVSFRDVQITDITCAAKGAHAVNPRGDFVLDVGAQSTRAIHLRDAGKVKEFHTNEKCAAGGGAFLERACRYLEISLESLGVRSLEAQFTKPISSVCAVLAESEIINHVSEGVPVNDIVRGLHESLAERALTQLKKVGLKGAVTLVGGVALQEGMGEACRRKFGVPVYVPDFPNFVTAHGAAVLALQRARRKLGEATRA